MDPASLPSGAVVLVVVILVLAAVTVFGIAAVTVGREAHRLDAVAPGRLRAGRGRGVRVGRAPGRRAGPPDPGRGAHVAAGPHGPDAASKGLQPPVAVDQVQEIVDPVVVDETDAVAYLIDQAERRHIDVTDEDVAHVVDAHLAYLAAIGAVGPVAEDDSPEVQRRLGGLGRPELRQERAKNGAPASHFPESACHRRRPPLRQTRCVRLGRRTAARPTHCRAKRVGASRSAAEDGDEDVRSSC